MASWLQNQFKKAEELFEAVDQTAKSVTVLQPKDARRTGRAQAGLKSTLSGQGSRLWKNDQSDPVARPVSRSSSFHKTESDTRVENDIKGSGAATDDDEAAGLNRSLEPDNEAQGSKPPSEPLESESELRDSVGTGADLKEVAQSEVPGGAEKGVESEKLEEGTSGSEAVADDGEGLQKLHGTEDAVTRDPEASGDANGSKPGADSSSEPDVPKDSQKVDLTTGNGTEETPEAPLSDDQSQKNQQETDEVQGLLKKQPTSGQTKEARLARICEKFQKRVAEYKKENEQLEEMLEQSREQQGAFEAEVQRLQQELSTARAGVGAVESSLSTALTAKNAELENLTVALEGAKRQAAMAEGKLAALQANSEALTRGRDMTESKMVQALREELTTVEKRLDEERAAHTSSRQAAAARETELENSMSESTTALARMQRTVDERNQKVADMEHKVSMLEVECSTLNQELQEAEARMRREYTRANSVESDAQTQQINAWREEAERARRAQREAENKFSDLEAEAQKLRVETAALRREHDSSSVQAQAALEKRFRELTELLYSKQTQLETLSSEKAAAVLQLEKEMRRFQEFKDQTERERKVRSRQNMMAEEDVGDMRSLEHSLADYDIKLGKVNANSIRTAAKFLDFGTISAGRFLWRRPLARLGFLFYLVCLHGFIMYLLHRLQIQAERSLAYGAQDYAAAAGLVKPSLSNGETLPG
ncbi:Golgi autoantigen [Klebsormidium nitens]|uniref:Golgi autoantigen n=1 Tax=Klebsormidium nitens TaxID=105231 RepID=A0A1Y1HP12_KLENI|nr:Golgi autoantigen [Klebsormidium nitens]|eukprot:GAQ80374.1 Golgi autoantigen [Klebsormidium nitens]